MTDRQAASPAKLVAQMTPAARARFATDAAWAKASGVPKETLARLKSSRSCDLRTLGALAQAAGCTLVAVPEVAETRHGPSSFDREEEEALLALCASGSVDASRWSAHGPSFSVAGLAVLLAGARGFDRERYLRLGEALHPGISAPEVFGMWLRRSPVRPSRFLPMLRRRMGLR